VRALAGELGLRTADKPDSQDVCFITAKGRASFLGARIPLRAAVVVDADGEPVGAVDAVELVTVGQRRGIAGTGGSADRRYVVDVDVAGARVTLGHADDLLVDETAVGPMAWSAEPIAGRVLVQTSAHGATALAVATKRDDGTVSLCWHAPHRRVAPGQSVVLYDASDTCVLGGGPAE
jgi:tRNA-uridine 2-sulfurtransferase